MKRFVEKRAWVRENMGKPTSDGEFLSAFAAKFRMRDEAKAALELKEILDADAAVEQEFADSSGARHLGLGRRLLEMMVAAGEFGPAAQVWRAMGLAKGLEQQKIQLDVSGGPDAAIVRARIAALMARPAVRERADAVGLDLGEAAAAAGYELPELVTEPVEEPAPREGPLKYYKPQLP